MKEVQEPVSCGVALRNRLPLVGGREAKKFSFAQKGFFETGADS